MRGQGGSKKKKNDSLNTSQSSVNTTQSSGIVDGNQSDKRGRSSRSVKGDQGCKEKISQNDLEVRIIFKQRTAQQHEVNDKNSHKNTGVGKDCGHASEMYELDGSVDGGKTRNRRSASRKGSKVVKEVVDQDNVVSSSTNEQNVDCDSSVEMENRKRKVREIITKRASLSRTRNGQQVVEENQSSMSGRTLRSRNSVHEVDSDSEGDSTLEKAEVKAKQPGKRNTSGRSLREEVLTKTSLRNRKKMPVIIESDSDTSIELESREQEERRKPGKKLEQGSSRGKNSKGGVRISDSVVEEEADMEVRWTEEETNKLEDACKINNPAHPMYWLRVAEAVGTKTAEECSERFFRDSHTARTRSEKKKPVKEKPKVTSLTANKGTLKRKQQLRDMLNQGNQDYEDDLFESTPFKAKKRKAATFGLDDEDDEAIYEELAHKQGKSRFETPKGDFSVGYIKPMAASSKKTPLSRVDEDMFTQKRDLDGYVHRIMKRRMVNKKKKVVSKHDTPKPPKPAVEVQDDADPRIIQKLFKDIMKENNTDKENHEDSEHEEDYYWDENIAETSS